MWYGVPSYMLHKWLFKASVFGLTNTNSLRYHLDSELLMSYLWLRWQLCSRGQWIHVWTFTSFALNPTWMKPAHSMDSAHHECLESWTQFMPRKLKDIKDTFYAKFKTPSLIVHLHLYNCIDSIKASPHLAQQKQEKDVALLLIFITELYRGLFRPDFKITQCNRERVVQLPLWHHSQNMLALPLPKVSMPLHWAIECTALYEEKQSDC